MSLLSAHLEQITLTCQGIDSLPFPPPKIFTNALLANNDITSLIRDTEAHERALFSVPPPPPAATAAASTSADPAAAEPTRATRRQTVFNVAAGEVTTGPPAGQRSAAHPRRHTAVSAVLGGDLHAQISRRGGGEVDIEVLLQGADKLCGVYALPGALERIPALRSRYTHQCNTLAYYEAKVAEQSAKLTDMNRDWMNDDEEEEEKEEEEEQENETVALFLTEEDLRREEEEVKELERRKRELQETLSTMNKDLGGLLEL